MTSRTRFAARRVRTAIRPAVRLTDPPPMTIGWNLPVATRDGTVLRANVFRPVHEDPVPAIVSMHPYRKDAIPAKSRSGRGLNFQYRLFPQPGPISVSPLAGWEAPDPAWWVPHGYAVVNVDCRGGGTSEGTAELFSDTEALDYHDVVEWVAAQPWCTGRVGLDGVSYLAISQYKAAATRPPHLAAICPWEGFSDLYRDFARPGGIREDGFTIIWSAGTRRAARTAGNLRAQIVARPERDDWYQARTPDLAAIEVPMLECASFSDHSLHSRGSFEAFRRSGSARKWLTTHRGGKWATYYSPEASAERLAFFDHVLKGRDNGWDRRAPVLVKVYEAGPEPVETVPARTWPPEFLTWTTLHLDAATGILSERPPAAATAALRTRRGSLRWTWTAPRDLDVIGPMRLSLSVSLADAPDALLFAVVRKFRGEREVCFEGSYGFSRDAVSRGWQRLAHRALDESLSAPGYPVHRHDRVEPLRAGEITAVEIALLPHATRFRAGERLQVEIRGRWPYSRNPLIGQFPAGYQHGRDVRCTVHTGGDAASSLLLGVRELD